MSHQNANSQFDRLSSSYYNLMSDSNNKGTLIITLATVPAGKILFPGGKNPCGEFAIFITLRSSSLTYKLIVYAPR